MTTACIGLRSDGSIDLDFREEEEGEGDDRSNNSSWNFNNLTIEEAEFVLSELSDALRRAKARWPKKKMVEVVDDSPVPPVSVNVS